MRVALVVPANFFMAPYLQYYIDILEENKIAYDIICWNRLGVKEPDTISFEIPSEDSKQQFLKLFDYVKFVAFVKKQLSSNEYDKVIIFTVAFGLLLYPYLKKIYYKKYILDIRDYSPVLSLIKSRFKNLIKDSSFTVLSSPGYLQWMPKGYSYLISHNYIKRDKIHELSTTSSDLIASNELIIVTIGGIRDYSANESLIMSLANDHKFILRYIGDGVAVPKLKTLATAKKVFNIEFLGRYHKRDEAVLLKGTSFINILTDDGVKGKTLLANRFYLALQHKIPVLVNSESIQGQLVKDYRIGVVLKKGEAIKSKIFDFISSFDRDTFNRSCEDLLAKIDNDQSLFREKVSQWLLG